MKGLLGTMYNDEMNVTGRDLREVGVEIDAGDNITVEVDVTRCGDMIENIDGPNTSKLAADQVHDGNHGGRYLVVVIDGYPIRHLIDCSLKFMLTYLR